MRNFNRFPAASAAWSAGTEQLAASSGLTLTVFRMLLALVELGSLSKLDHFHHLAESRRRHGETGRSTMPRSHRL